jgi:hypothetical protein
MLKAMLNNSNKASPFKKATVVEKAAAKEMFINDPDDDLISDDDSI